jgi:hypothetical protein
MANYVRGTNPTWLTVDLNGKIVDDTYYLFVLQNELPYLPAVVWQDPSANVPWTNPIQYLANGTLPNNIYYDNGVVYRLEIRDGPTQSDLLIALVENYIPTGEGRSPSGSGSIITDNQITNSQFSIVNFTAPTTFSGLTDPAPIELAPGWTLNLAGTGNVTLDLVPLNNSAGTQTPTNAPYALQLTLSGAWTSAYLAQRFNQNGNIWSTFDNSLYVASSVTARLQGASAVLSAQLVNSNNDVLTNVLSPVTITQEWTEYTDYGLMPGPMDSNFPPSSYIEYQLILPTTVDIYLSSFQLISSDLPSSLPYSQDSVQRQIDHTFNVYKDPIISKPSNSYLIGWDFPNNTYPYGTSGNITTTPAYIANQTIACASGANIAWSKSSITNGLSFVTADSNNAFYLLQYLTGSQVKNMLGNSLSVNIFGYQTTAGNASVLNVYLFRGSSSASIPTLPSTVGTLAADGTFTLNTLNWTTINRTGFPSPIAETTLNEISTNAGINSASNDYNFSGWEITDSAQIGDTDKFAIVVTFAYIANPTNITINSISVVPGDLPARPAVSNPITSARKTGNTAAGSYSTTSDSYVNIDASFLSYTTVIPIGYDLHINCTCPGYINGPYRTTYSLGILDSVPNTLCGWGIVSVMGNSGPVFNGCTALVQGDGKSHTFTLQWANSLGVSGYTLSTTSSANNTPTMNFLMVPSN